MKHVFNKPNMHAVKINININSRRIPFAIENKSFEALPI